MFLVTATHSGKVFWINEENILKVGRGWGEKMREHLENISGSTEVKYKRETHLKTRKKLEV